MPELEPKFGVFDFPFLFADRAHVYKVVDGPIGDELNQAVLRNKGVRVLSWGELGFRHFTNAVRPITKPEDLKGLKIRVPPNKIRVAAIKAMGAAATPIPWKELYTALQQRVVDGQENPTNAIVSLSMWEVQKFVSLSEPRLHAHLPAGQRALLPVAPGARPPGRHRGGRRGAHVAARGEPATRGLRAPAGEDQGDAGQRRRRQGVRPTRSARLGRVRRHGREGAPRPDRRPPPVGGGPIAGWRRP